MVGIPIGLEEPKIGYTMKNILKHMTGIGLNGQSRLIGMKGQVDTARAIDITFINKGENRMKYAWYTEDKNTGVSFCGVEDQPMQLDDALQLTHDTSEEKAFSVPAFETAIIANKVNYGEDFIVDGKHSILDEVAFEEWHGKNYMVINTEFSSKWDIFPTIKGLYNKGFIRRISSSRSSVTITWVHRYDHYKEQKFIFSKDKDFENKSFLKMVGLDTYYLIQDFCKANLG